MNPLRPLFPLVAALTLLTAGCTDGPRTYSDRFPAFGTQVEVRLTGVGKEQAEAAIRIVEMDLQQMDRDWHVGNPSPLVHVNQKFRLGRNNFKCPEGLMPVIETGQKLALRSDHLFNPAIGDLIAAWGFHRDSPAQHAPPSKQEIERLLAGNPRMDNIYFNGPRIASVNQAVQLDLRGYARGLAVDMAVRKLQAMGIPAARVDAGGKLRVYGTRGDKPWQVEIRNPFKPGTLARFQATQDEAAATTAMDEQQYESVGRRVHPIIDPRTGYPAQGVSSVTVIHPDATTADAASTALFIAGKDGWHRVARQLGIRYVLLIDDEGRLHMNPEMKARLRVEQEGLPVILSEPLADAPAPATPQTPPAAGSASSPGTTPGG